jgi:hypothetical protein
MKETNSLLPSPEERKRKLHLEKKQWWGADVPLNTEE